MNCRKCDKRLDCLVDNEEIRKLKCRAIEIQEGLPEENYSKHHAGNFHSVDVKRSGDWKHMDIEDYVKKYPPKIRSRLIEEFSEDRIDGIWRNWMEWEAEDCLNMFKDRGKDRFTEEKWYRENLQTKIEKGKKTTYPALDNLKTKKAKLKELEKWIARDKKYLLAFYDIDDESVGFYGNQGGHFCLRPSFDLMGKIEDTLWYCKDVLGGKGDADCVDIEEMNSELDDIKEAGKSITLLLDYVKDWNDGMSFKEEMEYRVGEEAEEIKKEIQRGKEINTARTLAKKHGYIMCREV